MGLGLALVGCGNRGVNQLAQTLKRTNKLHIVAVCDVDAGRLEEAMRRLEVPGEQDHRRLLERPEVDAVLVATGVRWHAPVALDAIAAGKHVFVEKPLADTPAAARKIAEAARAKGVVGLVGYQQRMNPFAQALRAEVAAIEPVQALFTQQRVPLMAQFFIPDHFGGILDTTTHTLDLALWTMGGTPEGVVSHVRRGTIQGDRTIEYASLVVDMDGGTRSVTVVTSMLGVALPPVFQFVGAKGTLWSDNGRLVHIANHNGVTAPGPRNPDGLQQRTLEIAPAGDTTLALLEHFADLVRDPQGTPRLGCTFEEGAWVVGVTAAMAAAEEQGRRVTLAELG